MQLDGVHTVLVGGRFEEVARLGAQRLGLPSPKFHVKVPLAFKLWLTRVTCR